MFFALSLARLLENKCDSFNGFNGQMILMAWRKSYPKALGENASCEQIAKFVQSYSPDQLEGLQKPVKGKLLKFTKTIMKITMEISINQNYMRTLITLKSI